MDKRDADILYFVSFCIEQYKMLDILHTQGSQWLMQEIDDYIKNKQR